MFIKYNSKIQEVVRNISNELKDMGLNSDFMIGYEQDITNYSRIIYDYKNNNNSRVLTHGHICNTNKFIYSRLLVFLKMLYSFEKYKINITPEILAEVLNNCFHES